MLETSLLERERRLTDLIGRLEERLPSEEVAKVRASYVNGRARYFVCREGDDEFSYAKKKEMPAVKDLAQKNYEEKVFTAANDELKAIERLMKVRNENTVEKIYSKANIARKKIIEPVAVDDEEFARRWQESEFQKGPLRKTTRAIFPTKRGDKVKHESEVIIADKLFEAGVPYKYECNYGIDCHVAFPDFVILKKSERKEYIWEHLFNMEDPVYRNWTYEKLSKWAKMGLVIGKNVIVTFEEKGHLIDPAIVDSIIKEVFL